MVGESQLPGGLIAHSRAKYYSLSGCVVNPRSRPGIKDMQRRKKNVEMYLCMYVGMQADGKTQNWDVLRDATKKFNTSVKEHVLLAWCFAIGSRTHSNLFVADSIFIVAKSKHFKHRRWEALLKRESIEDDFL